MPFIHSVTGRDVARQVERARHDLVEAEHGVDGADLRVHVADPDEPVALDAVPEILLHVEMDRVGADLPDAVEPLVVAPERADVGNVADLEHRAHLAQFHGHVAGRRVVDAHEAKAARADHLLAQPRQRDDLVAHGVVVLRVLFAAEFGHGLGGRLAEAHAHLARLCLSASSA